MKVTVTVPVLRDGEKVDLALTKDDDGQVSGFLPPAARKAKATFEVDAAELLSAATVLARSDSSAIPLAIDEIDAAVQHRQEELRSRAASAPIPGQMDVEEVLADVQRAERIAAGAAE